MPATEDSVLTSLNELRRLRKERRKKGHSAGGGGGNGRSQKAAPAKLDPMGDQVTPPPRSDLALGAKGMRAGVQAGMGGTARRAASAGPGLAGPVAATWDAPVDPAAFAQMARPSSSAKPAIVVAVVFLVAAGAGYVKLQNDTQALLAEKDASIRRVEEGRVQAVEAAAQAERQVQVKLKACEAKTQAASAAATTTAAAPIAPAATAAVAPASSAVSAQPSSRGRHKPSAGRHAAAASTAPAPSTDPTAVPQLPRKKRLDNDPLAGIKI